MQRAKNIFINKKTMTTTTTQHSLLLQSNLPSFCLRFASSRCFSVLVGDVVAVALLSFDLCSIAKEHLNCKLFWFLAQPFIRHCFNNTNIQFVVHRCNGIK